ncbi:MAG TPA: hypothetical protein VGJ18_18285 [Gemmatimonadaceae bacterium]
MTSLIPVGDGSPRHRRRRRRWTAREKAAHLDAFRRSGSSAVAFCRARQIPHSTFALWQREARRTEAIAFARVELGPAITPGRERVHERGDAIRLVVRSVAGHEAALDGVDATTALQLVRLVLDSRR